MQKTLMQIIEGQVKKVFSRETPTLNTFSTFEEVEREP
jgi:hypothetical protein